MKYAYAQARRGGSIVRLAFGIVSAFVGNAANVSCLGNGTKEFPAQVGDIDTDLIAALSLAGEYASKASARSVATGADMPTKREIIDHARRHADAVRTAPPISREAVLQSGFASVVVWAVWPVEDAGFDVRIVKGWAAASNLEPDWGAVLVEDDTAARRLQDSCEGGTWYRPPWPAGALVPDDARADLSAYAADRRPKRWISGPGGVELAYEKWVALSTVGTYEAAASATDVMLRVDVDDQTPEMILVEVVQARGSRGVWEALRALPGRGLTDAWLSDWVHDVRRNVADPRDTERVREGLMRVVRFEKDREHRWRAEDRRWERRARRAARLAAEECAEA